MSRYISKIIAACCLGLAAAVLFAACKANDGAVTLRSGATPASTTSAGANTSTTSAPQAVATPADDVRRVTLPEMQKMLASGEAVLVDVRDENSYRNGHITGSIVIPRPELVSRMSELPKDKLIVFYCA